MAHRIVSRGLRTKGNRLSIPASVAQARQTRIMSRISAAASVSQKNFSSSRFGKMPLGLSIARPSLQNAHSVRGLSSAPSPSLEVLTPLPAFSSFTTDGLVDHIKSLIKRLEAEFGSLEEVAQTQHVDWSFVVRLQNIEEEFGSEWGLLDHMSSVKDTPELRKVIEELEPEKLRFVMKMAQSPHVYEGLEDLKRQARKRRIHLSPTQTRVVDNMLTDARLSGISLPKEKRERFNELQEKLSSSSRSFMHHILDATKAYHMTITDAKDVQGMPERAVAFAYEEYCRRYKENEELDGQDKAGSKQEMTAPSGSATTGPWSFSLAPPSFQDFLMYAPNPSLRKELHEARASMAASGELDNRLLIETILKSRTEVASLLGFSSWADKALVQRMANDPAEVSNFLTRLRDVSLPVARSELEDLQKYASEQGHVGDLLPSDVPYWAAKYREHLFEFDEEDLRPYFQFRKVLSGLFEVVESLFGVVIREAPADVWHGDVSYYEVYSAPRESERADISDRKVITGADGSNLVHIASFFVDPYSRPAEKRGGAWMNECLARRVVRRSDMTVQGIQLPVAYLICNQTPPSGDSPSLMSFQEVLTLFHEFGHCAQHMFTTVDEGAVSGIRGVEWDAVELPSQFMENWCYHEPTVKALSEHVKTGESLPDSLFEKLLRARTFRSGSDMCRQLQFSLTDMEIHTRFVHEPETAAAFPEKEIFGDKSYEYVRDMDRKIAEDTVPLPPIENDQFLCSFAHIFAGGYSAGYYSYKWAEGMSCMMFVVRLLFLLLCFSLLVSLCRCVPISLHLFEIYFLFS